MMQKNKNRPGYKKTKVGWIPEDWDAAPICTTTTYADYRGKTPRKSSSGRFLVTAKNIQSGYINYENSKEYIPEETYAAVMSRGTPKIGDVLITTEAPLGNIASVDREDIALAQRVIKYRANSTLLTALFLKHFMMGPIFQSSLDKESTGGTVKGIKGSRLHKLPLALPPLPEQIAIAEVLECWDKGIRTFEKKIEKKRLVKKGLMQKLLSGETRLPGFSKPWKNISLGKVFNLITTYAFSREKLTTEDVDNCDIYNIHYGDIHATYTGAILDLGKERRVPMLITSEALPSKMEFLKDGDLIMADVSENYEGIGACFELKNIGARKVTGGLHTFVLRDAAEQTADGFRGYLFREYGVAKELKRIATGVSVYSLSKSKLIEVILHLPPLDEQRAIAKILSAADAEIEALERKLALLKNQKCFLLNNLVTGTIRLPAFRECLP